MKLKFQIFCLALLSLLLKLNTSIAQNRLSLPDTINYLIEDSVLIHGKDGITLSAVVVRKKEHKEKLPVALQFSIYSDLNFSLIEAKYAADQGYVGIVADARGKRLSPQEPRPYETEFQDVNTVIDWIIEQPWSDGQVGMYGGSYLGFAQWAALKKPHPALKTIVPYVAAIPGQGLPMENNIFLLANYQWAFYVTNNKNLDDEVNRDNQRWNRMRNSWWESGAAFNRVDSLDGQPNPWFQKWLEHPAYDAYWQSMVPYGKEFSEISIPVLSVTGYYDDGQISAIQYLKDHYKYRPNAEHYLLIGPYDHFGAQRGGSPELRGYQVDSVAIISTRKITFQWLDYQLKNGTKPDLLKEKINFQVMGANTWRHSPSLDKMEPEITTFYLDLAHSLESNEGKLSSKMPEQTTFWTQEIDLADRDSYYFDYYPFPIIKDSIDRSNGFVFISEPLDEATRISGNLTGSLTLEINKKDLDLGQVLYELTPEGKYFQLTYFMGRASYLEDPSQRKLLNPGQKHAYYFDQSRYFSKLLAKGSRLVLILNVIKNPFSQINYGTGKDVSSESIHDAGEPLQVKWYNESFIRLKTSRQITN